MSDSAAVLLGGGPNTVHELRHPDGSHFQAGPVERRQHLDELTGHVRRFAADGPFWPRNDDHLQSAITVCGPRANLGCRQALRQSTQGCPHDLEHAQS